MKLINQYDKFTFFWKSESPFSQWYPSPFTINGKTFKTAEHKMMYEKAMLFSDTYAAIDILKANHPRKAKEIGRNVQNFDPVAWHRASYDIVYQANEHKFKTHPDLLKILLATEGTLLVEASPYDNIWGIGMDEAAALQTPKEKWPGKNQLGIILTNLRDNFLQSQNR